MVRGAWQATVHGVAKSRTQLSDLLSLTSGHRNFVNGCKFSNNQQDGLVCAVDSLMSRLSYPRESSVYLEHLHPPCAQGARGTARSSHLASRLPVPGSGQSQVKVGSVTGSPAGAGPQSRGQTRLLPSHCDNREGVVLLTAAITEPPGPR